MRLHSTSTSLASLSVMSVPHCGYKGYGLFPILGSSQFGSQAVPVNPPARPGWVRLVVSAWEHPQFEADNKTASRGQVELIQLRDGSGRKVCRRAHRRWTVEGKDIGDVFAVEEVVDAETDLRPVEERFLADGVVQEEIDVVVRCNIGLIVKRAVVVVVAADALLDEAQIHSMRLIGQAQALGVSRRVSHIETGGDAGSGVVGSPYGSIGIDVEAIAERGIGLRLETLREGVRTQKVLVEVKTRIVGVGHLEWDVVVLEFHMKVIRVQGHAVQLHDRAELIRVRQLRAGDFGDFLAAACDVEDAGRRNFVALAILAVDRPVTC